MHIHGENIKAHMLWIFPLSSSSQRVGGSLLKIFPSPLKQGMLQACAALCEGGAGWKRTHICSAMGDAALASFRLRSLSLRFEMQDFGLVLLQESTKGSEGS